MLEAERKERFMKAVRVLLLVVSLCSHAASTLAQENAAGFVGRVTDESGAVLPGVTVTATSPALQAPSVTEVTDAQGQYRIVPLPIGVYNVEYTLSGFQTFRQQDVRLSTGVELRLDAVMKVGTIAETITVAGAAPVVDVTSTATSTHFTADTLQLTPTSRNGLISIGAQAPGIKTQSLDVGGGSVGQTIEFKTYGQTWGSTILIEGMDTTVPDDSGMGGNYHDFFAIDEARVQSVSNGPEVATHGVAITLTMKSGGNDFHGSGSYGYMSPRFESDNLSDELKQLGFTHGNPLTRRTDQGADIGGRLIRNKLWFFTSGRYRQSGRVQLGGFKPDGTPAEGYTSEVVTNGKLSYQQNPANRFIFWSEWARKHDRALTVNEFTPWESRGSRVLPVKTWKGEWQATKGNSLMMSLLFGRWGYRDVSENWVRERTDAAKDAGIPHGFDIYLKPDQSDFADFRPATRDIVTMKRTGTSTGGGVTDFGKYDGKGTVTWYKPDLFFGNHEMKGSFDYARFWSIRARGSRGAAGDYELIFSNNTPFQITIHNSPLVPLTNLSYTTGYVNDTWTVGRRLTLDLGVRYERDNGWVPPQCRLAGPFAPGQCIERIPFQVFNAITPRLYFSYDLAGTGKTVLKGGWGRFAAPRLMEEILVHPFLFSQTTYRWNDRNGNRNYDSGEVNLDPNSGDYVSGGAEGQTLSNPDEKQMKYDQFSLTIERQLAQNLGVRLSALYLRMFDQSRMLNTRRPPEAYSIPVTSRDPGPDGTAGNADDPGTFLTYYEYPVSLSGRNNEVFVISNDFGLLETHRALDVQLIKRISSGWQFLASFSATKNDIPLVRSSAGNRFIPPWNPNFDINNSDHTWEWVGKVSGTYVLPADVSFSGNFIHERGAPEARQVLLRGGTTIPTQVINADPLGSLRLPSTNVLDFRVDKSFRLPSTNHRVALRLNLYNALNASTVLARTLRAGTSYLRPTSILRPRIAEVGATYTF
jgi:hypothetical protein